MNVTNAAVSKWERGDSLPDITMLFPIADYFGVSVDALMGHDANYASEEYRMDLQIHKLEENHVHFVAKVYEENLSELHGVFIPLSEWSDCLLNNPDPDEMNFIVSINGKCAAWLKLNGILSESINISMLVVTKEYQRMGIGTFAIYFAENFAKENGKTDVYIRTTIDNVPARNCYEKLGYTIEKYIRYTVGDGVEREGILFKKNIVQ